MTRRAVLDEFAERRVSVDDGVAFHTDEVVERLWRFWYSRGRPVNVAVGIESAKARRFTVTDPADALFAEELLFWIGSREKEDVFFEV